MGIFSIFGMPNVSISNCVAFFFMALLYHTHFQKREQAKVWFWQRIGYKRNTKKLFLSFVWLGIRKVLAVKARNYC